MAELNARAEDPSLWNDPQKAQEVMRKRQDLDTRISGIRNVEQALKDNAELIEMGEAEVLENGTVPRAWCFHTVCEEHFEHDRYAERDLARLR